LKGGEGDDSINLKEYDLAMSGVLLAMGRSAADDRYLPYEKHNKAYFFLHLSTISVIYTTGNVLTKKIIVNDPSQLDFVKNDPQTLSQFFLKI